MRWTEGGLGFVLATALVMAACSSTDGASSTEPTKKEPTSTTTSTTTPTTIDGREAAITAEVDALTGALDLGDIPRTEALDAIAGKAASEAATMDNLDQARFHLERLDDAGSPGWAGIAVPVAWSWNNRGDESSSEKRISGQDTPSLDEVLGDVIGPGLNSYGLSVVEGKNGSLVGVLLLQGRDYEQDEIAGLEAHIQLGWERGFEDIDQPPPARIAELDKLAAESFEQDLDSGGRFDALAKARPGKWVAVSGRTQGTVRTYTAVAGYLSAGWGANAEMGVACMAATEETSSGCRVLVTADPPSDAARSAWQDEAGAGFRDYLVEARAIRGLPSTGAISGDDMDSASCAFANLVLDTGIGSPIDPSLTQPIFDTLPTGWLKFGYFELFPFENGAKWAEYSDRTGDWEPEPGSDNQGFAGMIFIDYPMSYSTCVRSNERGRTVAIALRGTADDVVNLPIVPFPTN